MLKYNNIRSYFLIQNITKKQKAINNGTSRTKKNIHKSIQRSKKNIKFINKCIPPPDY
jgi:hypothetical protein